jgi:pimeloyl-ACP methyl ester carboxylesterase
VVSARGCEHTRIHSSIDAPTLLASLHSGHRRQIQQDRQEFLANFLQVLGWPPSNKVVVVAASMGGTYGLPFVLAQPERVAGYVTVAALLDSMATGSCNDTPCSSAPCLLIWGELDDAYGDKPRLTEALFGMHQKVVYPKATHPCYLMYPELFSGHLLSFLGAVNATVPTRAPEQVAASDKVLFTKPLVNVHAAW